MAAKKKKEESKPKENTYMIPLRGACSRHVSKRTEKAVRIVREFLKKHTKSKNVKLSPKLNEFLWARGRPKPPRSVRVKTTIEEDKVSADLVE